MAPRILFLVNGLGLGNSTRCHAIIQELAARGAVIEVVTSDNGLWFFADRPEPAAVTAVPSLRYGAEGGRISILRTLAQLRDSLAVLRDTEAVIGGVVTRFRPQAVVADSVYALRAVRRAGVPLAALNNADMVVRGMARLRHWPASVLPQFLAVELADCLYNRLVPDLAISPRLDPGDTARSTGLFPVGPIVRRECRSVARLDRPPRRVAIMLSGSVFGSPVRLARRHDGLAIDVIGRPRPEPAPPEIAGLTYHGRIRDTLGLVGEADLVVVNGGYSAVSEAYVMGKPMVVVPVPRHAEQWVNAATIARLGLGVIGSEETMERDMEEALDRLDAFRAAYAALPPPPDGAAQAAERILSLAAGTR